MTDTTPISASDPWKASEDGFRAAAAVDVTGWFFLGFLPCLLGVIPGLIGLLIAALVTPESDFAAMREYADPSDGRRYDAAYKAKLKSRRLKACGLGLVFGLVLGLALVCGLILAV